MNNPIMRFATTGFALSLLATAGCYYEDDDDDVVYVVDERPTEVSVFNAVIATGETLTTAPGEGAGVFVEYLGSGQWHVFAACDTELSGYQCNWDVLALAPVGVDINGIEGEALEASDALYTLDSGSAGMATYTAYGLDGYYFETDPGVTVRFDVLIDGARDARYIYWVGEEQAVHTGAPSNPIDLTPTTP